MESRKHAADGNNHSNWFNSIWSLKSAFLGSYAQKAYWYLLCNITSRPQCLGCYDVCSSTVLKILLQLLQIWLHSYGCTANTKGNGLVKMNIKILIGEELVSVKMVKTTKSTGREFPSSWFPSTWNHYPDTGTLTCSLKDASALSPQAILAVLIWAAAHDNAGRSSEWWSDNSCTCVSFGW